ncbi:TRAP transporter substrate-binding protein [Salipiger sp. CCB-MM3]|uniref:TRAP transporter substrate-binding protein n=1 Tax=Salipiger sp. CCB-MM3 TaxID=1792508 RepID=UPI0008242016|nr:TRAP transporter substrate-binding protein [Salipiger sp. CCB-MM3]
MDRRTFVKTVIAGSALSAAPALPALAGPGTLRIGLITPPSHQWSKSAEALAARLAEASGGRIALSVHAAGQLGSEAQMLQQLQAGALDMAFLTLGELSNRNAQFGALTAPYLVRDMGQARRLLAGATAQELLAKAGRLGLVGLGFGMAGMRQVLLREPAPAGEALQGRKIRTVPLAQELDFWRRVGAAPTPLPLPALYDALANGQIDGMQIDFEGTWNSRYFEHASEMLASDHMIFPMIAVGSGRRWATLSHEDRALIDGAVAETLEELRATYEEIDAIYRAKIEEAGFPVRSVDRSYFGGAVDAWYSEWRVMTPVLERLEAEAAEL